MADLEWKLTYVGSAESEEFDQVLDTVLVGPVPEGRHKFVFEVNPPLLPSLVLLPMASSVLEAEAPDPARVPATELVGVTVVLLSCAYDGKDFIKVPCLCLPSPSPDWTRPIPDRLLCAARV